MAKSKRETGYRRVNVLKKEKDGQKFEVLVYMKSDQDGDTIGSNFLAVCEHENCKFRVGNDDLEDLKEEIDKRIETALGLPWENKIYVTVKGSDRNTNYGFDKGASLVIEYGYLQVVEEDGHPIHRFMRGDKDIRNGLPSTGMFHSNSYGLPGMQPDVMGAIIDDTPENRESLESILGAMAALRTRLMGFLSPDKIMQSLEDIMEGNIPALPAPQEET